MRQPAQERQRKRLGRNIRQRRQQLGISQETLAHTTGMHFTSIGKIERGERSPRFDTLVLLARALDLTASELVDGVK